MIKLLDLINYIAEHPEYINIVIIGQDNQEDDRTPMQAIAFLTCCPHNEQFRINGSLEKNTLLIY